LRRFREQFCDEEVKLERAFLCPDFSNPLLPIFIASAPMASIKRLALQGTFWTVASFGTSYVLRFGSNLVLTRLLFPELFGLMSLAYVFITGLHLFSDIGLHTSIIQNKRGDEPDFLNTAWTMQVIRGIGLWLCCLIISPLAAHFYQEPQLLWVLPVAGLNTLISAFGSNGLTTLGRRMAVKQIAAFELSGQVVSIVVMLTWAYFHKSVWALLIGSLATSVFHLILSHRISPNPPNRWRWEKESVAELVSFGKWIFLSTALTFFAMQSDRLILGKILGLKLLGVYGMAMSLSDIPKQVVMAVGGKVVFPMFTKFVDLPRHEFRARIRRGRWPILLPAAFLLAILISYGDVIVSILYDDRYANAGWMIPLMALGAWPVIMMTTIDGALFAMGIAKINTWAYFWSFLALIGGMWLGNHLYGVIGAVAAVPLSNVPMYAVIAYGVHKEKISCLDQDAYMTAFLLLTSALMIASRYAWGVPLPSLTLIP
jgi:O-antigen/teichoic acid export membrane protein